MDEDHCKLHPVFNSSSFSRLVFTSDGVGVGVVIRSVELMI